MKRNRRGDVGVTVSTSKKWFVGDEYYGAFQEFGWKAGKRTNAIRRKHAAVDTRKQIPGAHYVEKAFQEQGAAALRNFVTQVPVEIERVAIGG